MRNLILAVCKDPGGTNGILAVVNALKRNPHIEVRLIANGKAAELLPKKGLEFETFNSTAEVLIKYPKPAAFLTSMCSAGGIGRDLVPFYKRICPIISLQDFWLSYMATDWYDPIYRPDYMIVNDELSKTLTARAWPEYDLSRLVVTGFPALDRYFGIDTALAKIELRQILDLTDQNKMTVIFAGQGTGTGQTFLEFSNVLNEMGANIYLLPRLHPRMKDSFTAEIGLWNEAMDRFRNGTIVDTSGFKTIDRLLAGTDLIVSIFSTILVESAVLRKPNIAIIYGPGMSPFLKEARGITDEPPSVTLGCSAKAANRAELMSVMEKALSGKLDLAPAQEKIFKADGNNTRRAVSFIEGLLERKNYFN